MSIDYSAMYPFGVCYLQGMICRIWFKMTIWECILGKNV